MSQRPADPVTILNFLITAFVNRRTHQNVSLIFNMYVSVTLQQIQLGHKSLQDYFSQRSRQPSTPDATAHREAYTNMQTNTGETNLRWQTAHHRKCKYTGESVIQIGMRERDGFRENKVVPLQIHATPQSPPHPCVPLIHTHGVSGRTNGKRLKIWFVQL